MTLVSDEIISRYYAESLVLLFFPGSKFPTDGTGGAPFITMSVDTSGEIPLGKVSITDGDKNITAVYQPDAQTVSRCTPAALIKLAVGGAMLDAGHRFTGAETPWGMITGVRPSKLVVDMFDKGISPADAAKILVKDYLCSPQKAEMAVRTAECERIFITEEIKKKCSLYIAIPFCPTKCSYCSFTSFSSPKLLSMIPAYLDRLCIDICNIFRIIRELGLELSTVYIGGGTPTVLDELQLQRLLSVVEDCLSGVAVDEFTVEAGRPDTINAEKLAICKSHGVTRISVNAQTLNDDILKLIGRAHTADDFFKAYETAESSGIRDINVDLIAGLPGEDSESFRHSVDSVVKLDPTNITVHTFYVKRAATITHSDNNVYRNNDLNTICSVDNSEKLICGNGYIPYYLYRQKNTVSNLENVGYSKPGHEGLYNIYMMGEVHTVFGAGASSMTKLVPPCANNAGIVRLCETKYPYEYLDTAKNTAEKRFDMLLSESKKFYSKS